MKNLIKFSTKKFRFFSLIIISAGLLGGHAFAAEGYATRYWDGCKPHCSWAENTSGTPIKTCNLNNQDNGNDYSIPSACDGGDAFTCWDMAPKEISPTLSYAYAAVPATGDVCGKCYQLTFTGVGKYDSTDNGSIKLKAGNKEMIVMATNIGYDVQNSQFDLLIPGGGVGAFNACSRQWNVTDDELGARYGGFLTQCRQDLGYNTAHDEIKSCVRNYCDAVFDESGMSDLKDGCYWFVDWFEVADNPMFQYQEVDCPQALIDSAYPGGADNGEDGETGTCSTVTLPGQIEAERFCYAEGMQIQDTSDSNGEQHLAWIDTDDLATYDISVPDSGTYKVEYRIASASGGALALQKESGTALGSLTVPSTGSYDTWQTIDHNVELTAGEQTIRVKATTGGWSLNWLNITEVEIPDDNGETEGVTAALVVKDNWSSGFVAEVTVTNDSDSALMNWTAVWDFNNGETISNMWNADYTQSGATVTVTPHSQNRNIAAGGKATFGFQGSGAIISDSVLITVTGE